MPILRDCLSYMVRENQIQITVLLPVWNEDKDTIEEVYLRLTNTLVCLGKKYEIIFVDDGSENGIFETLRQMHIKDGRVKVVRLARNFGQMVASLAGFQYAQGEIIITMDSDLQSAPEDIPKLIEKIDEGYEIVSGWRWKRKEAFFIRRLFSFFMNKLIELRTRRSLHDWSCSFNAIKKDIMAKFLETYDGKTVFIKPLIASISEKSTEVKISHYFRRRKKSRYSFLSLVKLFLDYTFNLSCYFRGNNLRLFLVKEILL